MKKILFILLIGSLFGCEKFAPEPEPFFGHKEELPKNEVVSVNGTWKLESGSRIEKYYGQKDSVKINFTFGVNNKIFTGPTDVTIDNVNVGYTTWVFDKTNFYYNSLDKYNYTLQLNKTIDIVVGKTKRLYYIQTMTSSMLTVKSATQYLGAAGENSNYSTLIFKKMF